jgi:hypothetical protein
LHSCTYRVLAATLLHTIIPSSPFLLLPYKRRHLVATTRSNVIFHQTSTLRALPSFEHQPLHIGIVRPFHAKQSASSPVLHGHSIGHCPILIASRGNHLPVLPLTTPGSEH